MPDYFKHASAIVETDRIGDATRIWAFAHVGKGAVIGRECNVGDHCYIEGDVRIGDHVTNKNGTSIWEGVSIENGAFIGPNVAFTNDLWARSPRLAEALGRYRTKGWLKPTRVGEASSIGANATIVCGVSIGRYAMVGAGSVVTRDVPPHALVYGNPARAFGYVCRCGAKLVVKGGTAGCSECGRRYEETGAGLRDVEPSSR